MQKEHITLTYDPGRADGPWFMSVGATSYPKGKGKYDKIKIDQGELGEIIFKIETKGILFGKTPIEVSLYPGQPGPGIPGQFTPVFGKDEKTSAEQKDILIVTDLNIDKVPTEYYYKLNFDTVPSLDPIIQNGCCRPEPVPLVGSNMSLVAESNALAALLLGAVVIAFTALRLRYRRS